MRHTFESAATEFVRKARALFHNDLDGELDHRLQRLLARRKVDALRSPLERLSISAERQTTPLYPHSVYGSVGMNGIEDPQP